MTTTVSQDHDFGSDFLQEIVNWIAEGMGPEEVFGDGQLEQWARDNGFIKEDEL